ncbi:MAG TPA: PIG-L family deacetylase [Flavisolibacter sp.]|jgi:LmbE family N-acetylglucosaminyl deacetylase|nr:PIG-L family deacetylase [Flavisolibacter sp.]
MKACFFLLLSLVLHHPQLNAQQNKKKVILAIFAHPDDETAIGPVLAKYAKENTVYVVLATDGRDGTRVTSIPAGDSLAKVRRLEGECSCKALGIEPPIYLSATRLDTKIGVGEFFKQAKQTKEKLKRIIERLQPDIIITFGPDGDTGHAEHRVVGGIVTELLLQESWVERYPLYYFGWTKTQAENQEVDEVMYADEKYLPIVITYNDEEEAKNGKALHCHKSQYTDKEMKDFVENDKNNKANRMYFRRFAVDMTKKTDFFQ